MMKPLQKKVGYVACHLMFVFFPASTLALTLYDRHGYPTQYHCPPPCPYYSGYHFDRSDYDYEVDNACVDFCIDKKHTLQQCMRSCSNYSRAIDYR